MTYSSIRLAPSCCAVCYPTQLNNNFEKVNKTTPTWPKETAAAGPPPEEAPDLPLGEAEPRVGVLLAHPAVGVLDLVRDRHRAARSGAAEAPRGSSTSSPAYSHASAAVSCSEGCKRLHPSGHYRRPDRAPALRPARGRPRRMVGNSRSRPPGEQGQKEGPGSGSPEPSPATARSAYYSFLSRERREALLLAGADLLHRATAFLPGLDPAIEVGDVPVAHPLVGIGGERRSSPGSTRRPRGRDFRRC